MNQLEQVRQEINRIDEQMAALFERRMHAAEQVAAYKKEQGLPILDAGREQAVLEKNMARLQDAALVPFYRAFLTHMIELSKQYQAALLEK